MSDEFTLIIVIMLVVIFEVLAFKFPKLFYGSRGSSAEYWSGRKKYDEGKLEAFSQMHFKRLKIAVVVLLFYILVLILLWILNM